MKGYNMKTYYRNFELEAHREKCMAGYSLLYFTICDQYDLEWNCGFQDSSEHVREIIKDLKQWVDEFYENIDNKICFNCYEELDENLYCKYCDIDYKKYIK